MCNPMWLKRQKQPAKIKNNKIFYVLVYMVWWYPHKNLAKKKIFIEKNENNRQNKSLIDVIEYWTKTVFVCCKQTTNNT